MRLDFDRRTKEEIARRCGFDVHVRLGQVFDLLWRGEHYVRGHYSRDDGRESMMRKMEEIMRDATGEQREIIRRAMDELRNA